MDLGLDPDELNTCVGCGLCLPHCPTFRVTGDETMSPRGRIRLMREVQDHAAPLTDEVVRSFETCVQCRGCETACPAAVPYGHLIEQTRATLADQHRTTPRWQRVALGALTHPRLLASSVPILAVAQRAHLVPGRLGLGRLPLRRRPLTTSGGDVFLFTGCVMDAWQREVHQAGQRVLEAMGFGVTPTGAQAPCCGALHGHAGLADRGRAIAGQVIGALGSLDPDDPTPIVVDAAGCGAALKDYGRIVGTDAARAFSARVVDIGEFVAAHIDRLPAAPPLPLRVAVQDPCHLRHVQRVHLATRVALAPYVAELVELDDEGLCCGAGGAYSMLEPELAGDIRDRKLGSIGRAAADVVASANPGCSMHLRAAGVEVVHPMELLDRALAAR